MINNHVWVADEEITFSKMNNLNSDANNRLDNIHPQYFPDIIDLTGVEFGLQAWHVNPKGNVYGDINVGGFSVDHAYLGLINNFNNSGPYCLGKWVFMKSSAYSKLRVTFKGNPTMTTSSTSYNAYVNYLVRGYENPMRIVANSTYNFYMAYNAWTVNTFDIDISAEANGSLIDLLLNLDYTAAFDTLDGGPKMKEMKLSLMP